MPEVSYDVELEKAFVDSFEKEPVSYSWGFFAYDDTPGAAGGGAGNFSWFDSKQQLLTFVSKFPLIAHSAAMSDSELFLKAKQFVSSTTLETFDQKAIDGLNQINVGVEQIQWFGQFDDLLSGQSEFAQGLRKFFSGSTEKLTKSQIPEFGEFLRNWGH